MIVTSLAALLLAAGASQVAGDWQTDCTAETAGGQQLYAIHQYSFTDTDFTYTIEEYQRSNCSGLVVTYQGSGTYASPSEGEGTAIDFTYVSSTMTPASGFVAGFMNRGATCGVTDWQGGTAQDVAGLTCNGEKIPGDGDVVHDTYQLNDDTLMFGDGLSYTKQ